jgi:hypothetical protein
MITHGLAVLLVGAAQHDFRKALDKPSVLIRYVTDGSFWHVHLETTLNMDPFSDHSP